MNVYKETSKSIRTACLYHTGLFLLLILCAHIAGAEDWPVYQHDNYRSGVTQEVIDPLTLKETWAYRSPQPPQTAWHGPAKWDAYANINGLQSMRNYDPVFFPIIVGDALYFGSTADDSVYCYDAVSGEERWSYCTDGAIRIAPTYWEGKLYFGSDDGYAYCLNADGGSLLWRHSPSPKKPLIPSNGKFINLWPCRSSVLIQDGIAYFTAAMLPWEESYLCAVDANTGTIEGTGLYTVTQNQVTMEGALLASKTKLYVPQGRRAPMVFDRAAGRNEGTLGGGGGVFVLLTQDEHVYHGPGNKTGWITDSNAQTRDSFATIQNARRMLVSQDTTYVLMDDRLIAMDRNERKILWSVPSSHPFALIKAGEILFAGGDSEIAAYSAADGERIWTAPVVERAYGLAVANGGLFASTTAGVIHVFRNE